MEADDELNDKSGDGTFGCSHQKPLRINSHKNGSGGSDISGVFAKRKTALTYGGPLRGRFGPLTLGPSTAVVLR